MRRNHGRPRPRGVTVLVLTALLVLAVGGIAWAGHIHTVGEWYHGIGDGADSDQHVHPFNDNTNDHLHSNHVSLYRDTAGVLVWERDCVCTHNHTEYDTAPYAECRYKTYHRSSGSHSLNGNTHLHHNWCG
jgi:hypothetical protein